MYTPGAGTLPPVLAGRDDLIHDLGLTLTDVATAGRARAQDVILVGPRGIGKTVTLTTCGRMAAAAGSEVVNLQAVAGRSGLVSSLLQRAASRTADRAGPWTRAGQGDDGAGTVSPSTLAEALASLAAEVRRDAPGGGLLITVDEMQVASHDDLALLAATLHRLDVDHPTSAVMFAGTGPPHPRPTVGADDRPPGGVPRSPVAARRPRHHALARADAGPNPPQELSWIRQDLVDEGDVYSPKRGRLALAVPVFVRLARSRRRVSTQRCGGDGRLVV